MKKKLICFKSLLFIAAFCAALGACRSDELVVREVSKSTAVAEKADTFSLKIDFPTTIHFDGKITATNDVTMADEANAEDKNTRAALHVNQDGTTTINLTTNGEPLKVFLILRNQDGSKVYVSANNTWNLVSGETTKVEASGKYTFIGVKGATGAPTWTKDEVWYLDAMTGGEWDAAKKAYEINKTCAIPKKMFNAGENVRLGTNMTDGKTDIVVPFLLGTDEVADAGERKWGVRMAVANDNRNSNALTPRLVCIDAAPNFMPYGSLLCMRFRNHVKVVSDTHGALTDPVFAAKTAVVVPNNFSYYLRSVSVESTSSTTGGCIKMDELSSPTRDILPWHPYKAGITDYVYSANHQTPFKMSTDFDLAESNNLSSGYWMPKGKNPGDAGDWTPYYYLWVKSLDESLSAPIDNSEGLKVRCSMYNHTVKPETFSKGNARVFSRVFVASKKVHKTSHAYFANRDLDGEIFMPAVFYTAPDILFRDGRHNNTLTWPDSAIRNVEVAEPARFSYSDFHRYFRGKMDFHVDVFKGPTDTKGTSTRVKWIVPSRQMIRSVFPPTLDGLNSGAKYGASPAPVKKSETVNINGRVFTADSWYYNPRRYESEDSKKPRNYHVFYGLKFVGTPYCEVVRYTFYSQWRPPKGAGSTWIPDDTRFIIHSKHLGDVSFSNAEEVKAFFEQEVKSVVNPSSDPAPKGVPPYSSFWGDFWNPKPEDNVTMRIFHISGLVGGGGSTGSYELGRAVALAAVASQGKNPGDFNDVHAYQILDGGAIPGAFDFVENWYTNPLVRSKGRISVLPFISPYADADDPTAGEHH